jgi:hypothetical protein
VSFINVKVHLASRNSAGAPNQIPGLADGSATHALCRLAIAAIARRRPSERLWHECEFLASSLSRYLHGRFHPRRSGGRVVTRSCPWRSSAIERPIKWPPSDFRQALLDMSYLMRATATITTVVSALYTSMIRIVTVMLRVMVPPYVPIRFAAQA